MPEAPCSNSPQELMYQTNPDQTQHTLSIIPYHSPLHSDALSARQIRAPAPCHTAPIYPPDIILPWRLLITCDNTLWSTCDAAPVAAELLECPCPGPALCVWGRDASAQFSHHCTATVYFPRMLVFPERKRTIEVVITPLGKSR